MADMIHFSKYNPKLGFKFTVDAIHNIPNTNHHFGIFCLNPPGALY